MATSARCDCYRDHNSNSGRCNARKVEDPKAIGDAAFCERCVRECLSEDHRRQRDHKAAVRAVTA